MISHHHRLTARALLGGLTIAGLAVLGVVAFPAAASAATFSVTSTADAGAGSLRDAIANANLSAGPDTITFALPANSVIELLSSVTITDGLTIDGSGAPGLDITGRGGLGTYSLLIAAPSIQDQEFSFNDLLFEGSAGSVDVWTCVAIDTCFGAL
ncbi:MAG: hypothetical protein QOD50_66, partial [Actinomycetota bacterium]|nr:hypothetical protein [Actinomycetota bacterium]